MKDFFKIRDISEECGAGDIGTPSLISKYKNETPGQQATEEATKVDPDAKFDYDAWSKSGKKPHKPGIAVKQLAQQTRDELAKKKKQGVTEGLRDPKDNPCWKGYEPIGTKTKNGKTVPNCVPKNEDTQVESDQAWAASKEKEKERALTPNDKSTLDKVRTMMSKEKKPMKESRGLAAKYWSMAQDRKETADENKGNHEVYHTHMADHHDAMSRYHEELGQHTLATAHAKKADIHHEKSNTKQMKESVAPFKKLDHAVAYATDKVKTHRDNLDGIEVYKHKSGGYDVNHTMNSNGRNALKSSGAKHLGTVYKDKPTNIKEERAMTDAEMKKREDIVKGMKKGLAGFKARYGDKAKDVMYATATKQAMAEDAVEEAVQKSDIPAYLRKKHGQTPLKLSDVKDPRKDSISAPANLAKARNENTVPFDGPYTKTPSNVKDKSGAVHTPMSRARDLARQAIRQQVAKKKTANESVVPDHMKGKQKPYVSSDGKGNYEVLGNTGQTKATFSRATHGKDAHARAQQHLKNKYNDYMKEGLQEVSNKTLSSYVDKAVPSVHALDKAGQDKKADKRFDGVVKASDKMTVQAKKLREFSEEASYKVEVEGLPTMYITSASPSEVKQNLRKIIKKADSILSVDRVMDADVRKAFRLKAAGKEEE